MKPRSVYCLLCTLTLLLILAAAAPAVAQQAPGLKIVDITHDKGDNPVRAGEPVVFTVIYESAGGEPPSPTPGLSVTLTITADGVPQQVCTAAVEEDAQLKPDEEREVAFAECQVIPPLPGSYTLAASTSLDGAAPYQEVLKVDEYESALPAGVGQLFAGLGIFIAMMMVMALGTEIVLDSLKVVLGMKSKVTSLDALDKMGNMLPGQLAALGAGRVEQAQVTKLVGGLKETLKPIPKFTEAALQIQAGQFGAAFNTIARLFPQTGTVAGAQLEALKTQARSTLTTGILDKLRADLGLSQALVDQASASLDSFMSGVTVGSSLSFLEGVFQKLQGVTQQIVGEWLEGQRDALLKQGSGAVVGLFDTQVKPALEGLGLAADSVAAAHRQVELVLGAIDTKATATTDAYLESLKNLLDAVEERRNQVQSPLRKIWRYLRAKPLGSMWLSLVMGVTSFLLVWPVAALISDPGTHKPYLAWWMALLIGVGAGLVVGLVIFGLIGVMASHSSSAYQKYLLSNPAFYEPGKRSLPPGQVEAKVKAAAALHRLHRAELWWNLRLGDKESGEIDPMKFGDPLPVPALSATTAAQVLLDSSDRQRDQEDSRLRWLKVFAVLVGVVLASLLRVDAAVLLSTAMPSLAAKMNLFKVEIVGLVITPGILLTGLAASAGSTFWHDQLDRLQMVKKQAEAGAKLVQQIRGSIEEKEE